MTKEELHTLINSSFLNEARKHHAREVLEREGDSLYMYDFLNSLFQEELLESEKTAQAGIQKVDETFLKLVALYTANKKEREEQFVDRLINEGVIDRQRKNELWDDFYDNEERLRKEFEQTLRSKLSHSLITTVRDSLV